jgi:hypothetical protein
LPPRTVQSESSNWIFTSYVPALNSSAQEPHPTARSGHNSYVQQLIQPNKADNDWTRLTAAPDHLSVGFKPHTPQKIRQSNFN